MGVLSGLLYAAPYGGDAATALPDGRVLITQSSEIERELFDFRTGTFARTEPRNPWVQGSAALLLNGLVLLAGGNDLTSESQLAAVYNPSAEAVIAGAAPAVNPDSFGWSGE